MVLNTIFVKPVFKINFEKAVAFLRATRRANFRDKNAFEIPVFEIPVFEIKPSSLKINLSPRSYYSLWIVIK